MFKRSFYTVLCIDIIRTGMKAALDVQGVDDRYLIQTLSVISLNEKVRSNRMDGSNIKRKSPAVVSAKS